MRVRDLLIVLAAGSMAGWFLAPYATGWRGNVIAAAMVLIVTAICAYRVISMCREARGR